MYCLENIRNSTLVPACAHQRERWQPTQRAVSVPVFYSHRTYSKPTSQHRRNAGKRIFSPSDLPVSGLLTRCGLQVELTCAAGGLRRQSRRHRPGWSSEIEKFGHIVRRSVAGSKRRQAEANFNQLKCMEVWSRTTCETKCGGVHGDTTISGTRKPAWLNKPGRSLAASCGG